MKEYVASLVQQTLVEHFNEKDSKSSLLILLVGNQYDLSTLQQQRENLLSQFSITIVTLEPALSNHSATVQKEITHINELTQDNIDYFKEHTDIIYCPFISYGFLAKLSLLIDDIPSVKLTLQLLLKGTPVLVNTENIQTTNEFVLQQNYVLEEKIESYIKELKRYGIWFFNGKQLSETAQECLKQSNRKRTLLSVQKVREAENLGNKKIIVPKNCLITPMAKDKANELNIIIEREREEEK